MALYLTKEEQTFLLRLLSAARSGGGLLVPQHACDAVAPFTQAESRLASRLLDRVADAGIVLDPAARCDLGHHYYTVSRSGHDYDITTSRGEKIGTALHQVSAAAICQALDQFAAEKLPETLPDDCLLEVTAPTLTLEPADPSDDAIELVRGERKRITGGSLGYLLAVNVDGETKQYLTEAAGFRAILPGSEK